MHDYLNTKREFQFISSRQKVNDIIIFDNFYNNINFCVKLNIIMNVLNYYFYKPARIVSI